MRVRRGFELLIGDWQLVSDDGSGETGQMLRHRDLWSN